MSHAADDLTIDYQAGIGIRASFVGGVFHVEWDPVPTTVNGRPAPDYGAVVINYFACGYAVSEAPPCPIKVGTTHMDSDLTTALSEGALPIELPVGVTIIANGVYGTLSGRLRTPPISIEKVSGEGQVGSINKQLKEPFIIKAKRLGSDMKSYYGLGVQWSVIGAPAGAFGYQFAPALTPDTEWPYADGFQTFKIEGKVGAYFTFGSQPGEYKIEARCGECDNGKGTRVVFTVTTQRPKLAIDSGDGQTGRIGKPLKQMLVAKVTDPDGKGIPDKNVSFSLSSSSEPGAALSQLSGKTDPDGRIKASMTLGKRSGKSESVIAACDECDPKSITFTENTAKVTLKLTAENTTLWPAQTSGGPQSSNVTIEATDGQEGNYGPISGYDVNLEVEPIASTGHAHGVHPKTKAGSIDPSCTITGGVCFLTYSASEISGIEKIKAEAKEEPEVKDETDMTVKVPGLTVLGGGAYDLKQATATHPSSYWATSGTYLLIDVIARDYHGTFPKDPILTVTEASLEAGGALRLPKHLDAASQGPSGRTKRRCEEP